MIRKLEKADMGPVMQIWLHGNVEAHPFVPKEYWAANFDMVQEQIFNAEVYVFEANDRIKGFIGLADTYIAGIFVDKNDRSMGIGRQLLTYAKKKKETLSLNVYQQNKRALDFYHREGFFVSAKGMDEETQNVEYTMFWKR